MAAVDRVRERLRDARDRLNRAREGGGRGGGVHRGQGFDLVRVGVGERVAALGAVALLLLMLLDWFGGRNAWQLKWIDLVLFALAVLAIALAVTQALDREQLPRETSGIALAVGGAVTAGIMVTLVFESTGGTVPLVLSLFAAGGMLYGGLLALRPPSHPVRLRRDRPLDDRQDRPFDTSGGTRPFDREPPRG